MNEMREKFRSIMETNKPKRMDLCRYVKKFCNGSWKEFEERSKDFPYLFEQLAFTDESTWYDELENIFIESVYSIGD